MYPIIEKNRGCSDGEVISIVKERKGVLLTEDKILESGFMFTERE